MALNDEAISIWRRYGRTSQPSLTKKQHTPPPPQTPGRGLSCFCVSAFLRFCIPAFLHRFYKGIHPGGGI